MSAILHIPDGRPEYRRKVGRALGQFRRVTNDAAEKMAGEFLFVGRDGAVHRARANGKAKTWKRQPGVFRLPAKHGLRECFYVANGADGYAHVEGSPAFLVVEEVKE